MRINVDIEDALMAEARKACGQSTDKETIEHALRLMIRLRQQEDVRPAFGKHHWRGNLGRSRVGRGMG
jgi:Arc/MetJ family transcription regulator